VLIILRHGQTSANASGLLLGRSDPPLTDLGREQARFAALALPSCTRVMASPLARAAETARLAVPGAEIEIDDRWIEMNYGDFEGIPLSQVPIETRTKWMGDPTFRPPGGESLVDVGRRVEVALSQLTGEASKSDVLVVSHVSPIKAAVAWCLGVSDEIAWRMSLSLASITKIAFVAGKPSLVSYNDIHHLELSGTKF